MLREAPDKTLRGRPPLIKVKIKLRNGDRSVETMEERERETSA
jgi:hypothetical protein